MKSRYLASFSTLCPEAGKGLVVYSGETIPGIAAHFADVSAWCHGIDETNVDSSS